MLKISPTLLSIIFLSGCCYNEKEEFEFNDNAPKHILCYKVNEILYFENANNDVDTMMVMEVDSMKGCECHGFISPAPTGKSCWVKIKHLPFDKWKGFTIDGKTNDTTSIDYQELLTISKDPENNRTDFWFNFRNFRSNGATAFEKLNTDTININSRKISNYYTIVADETQQLSDSTSIEKLIWTDELGLTAYKNKNGDWWLIKK